MKITLIVAALLVAYAAGDECPVTAAMKAAMDDCAKKLNASDETIKNIQDDEGVDDKQTNCMRNCMLESAGLMKDGTMDIDKMEEMMKSGEDPNYEVIDTVLEGMRQCKEQSETSSDGCEVAGNYSKCFKAMKDGKSTK